MDDIRILIVDDDEAFLRSAAQLLTEEGYVCVYVKSSHQAIDSVGRDPFDLVIADLNMPGNEALELIHEIRYGWQELPVILVADSPSIDSAVQSIALPVTAYLVKPLDLNEFLSKVRHPLNTLGFCGRLAKDGRKFSNGEIGYRNLKILFELTYGSHGDFDNGLGR